MLAEAMLGHRGGAKQVRLQGLPQRGRRRSFATGVLALLAALTNVDHARRIHCMQVGRRVRRDLEAGSA